MADRDGSTPTTSSNLQRATVGEVTRLGGPVSLSEYSPLWPRQYEAWRRRIRDALGERVLLIEHVGSTSVPGLAAKPVIDICMAVADSADEPSYIPDLERVGYVLRIREPEWHEHRLLRTPDAGVNLHVFTVGSAEIDRLVAFRDRLRAHPEDRRLYEATKRRLASRSWEFMQDSADAKSDVVEAILGRAEARDETDGHNG